MLWRVGSNCVMWRCFYILLWGVAWTRTQWCLYFMWTSLSTNALMVTQWSMYRQCIPHTYAYTTKSVIIFTQKKMLGLISYGVSSAFAWLHKGKIWRWRRKQSSNNFLAVPGLEFYNGPWDTLQVLSECLVNPFRMPGKSFPNALCCTIVQHQAASSRNSRLAQIRDRFLIWAKQSYTVSSHQAADILVDKESSAFHVKL